VELPTPPDWTLWYLVSGLVLLLVFAIVAAAFRRKQNRISALPPAVQAQRRLARVQHQWQAGGSDDRETAYQLSTLLRLGLQQHQLTENCPAVIRRNRGSWHDVISVLAGLRYQPRTSLPISEDVFVCINNWLIDAAANHDGVRH
jgi:hypothetical protein